jgi:tyrosine ammonia-lyase
MTGMAALNDVALERLLTWSATLAVAYAEIFESNIQGWDPRLGHVRAHPGQQLAHQMLQARVARSQRLTKETTMRAPARRVEDQRLLQESYSVRCAPQALGAGLDVLTFHRDIVERELNSVTDNPVMFHEDDDVVHGGNFFGQHVAFASDALLNVVVQLMVWSERRVARMCDPKRNGELAAFLQPNQTGLHSGFMGAQVTSSALVAWARTHATPASIQSVPTNANNQDINTMGSMGAWRASQVLERAFDVMAIDASVCAQAITLTQRSPDCPRYSAHTQKMVEWVQRHVPFVHEDRPLSAQIQNLSRHMAQNVVQG